MVGKCKDACFFLATTLYNNASCGDLGRHHIFYRPPNPLQLIATICNKKHPTTHLHNMSANRIHYLSEKSPSSNAKQSPDNPRNFHTPPHPLPDPSIRPRPGPSKPIHHLRRLQPLPRRHPILPIPAPTKRKRKSL